MSLTEPSVDAMIRESMQKIDSESGWGYRIVGKTPRVKVYRTKLTRFRRRQPSLVGVFKTKKEAHKAISKIVNPKQQEINNG